MTQYNYSGSVTLDLRPLSHNVRNFSTIFNTHTHAFASNNTHTHLLSKQSHTHTGIQIPNVATSNNTKHTYLKPNTHTTLTNQSIKE